MEDNKFEILKRKKIRKLLLLKINDELKEISKYKSNIRINSKTIQELNEIYNKNDILLHEKSTIYYNYIKTEETIISKNIYPINISKVVNINKNSKSMPKIKKNVQKRGSLIERSIIKENSQSPVINILSKKIELGKKKVIKSRQKEKKKESVPNIRKKYIEPDKEKPIQNILNKTTKIGCDLNLHKLIEKITSIKNNESTEGIIRENIKKLRQYCYQLRKKKKRIRKISEKLNSASRKKPKDKEKNQEKDIFRRRGRRRSSITNKEIFNNSYFLNSNNKIDKSQSKSNSKNEINITKSSLQEYNININNKKKSTPKIIKRNNNIKLNLKPRYSNKNQLFFSSIKSKEKIKKKLSENIGMKLMNKLHKKRNKKSLQALESIHSEEFAPSLNQIPKSIMKSTIDESKMKFDINTNNNTNYNNNNEDNNNDKNKKNKTKFHKKILNKNGSIQLIYHKDKNGVYKYFNNTSYKKEKVELHDNLKNNKSNKKIRKLELYKKENENKNEENNEEIIKLKKLSIINDLTKKSKKRLIIDSPDRRGMRLSNFSNYKTSSLYTINNK